MAIAQLKKFKISTTPDIGKVNTLKSGDIVMRQYFDSKNVISSTMYVHETGTEEKVIDGVKKPSHYFIGSLLYGDEPQAGELLDFVRITNLFDPDREGALYLTANDDGAPFMDVVSGFVSEHSVYYPNKVGTNGYKSLFKETELSFTKYNQLRFRLARFTNSGTEPYIAMHHKEQMVNSGVWLISFKASASKNTKANFSVNDDINTEISLTTKTQEFFFPVTTLNIGEIERELKFECKELTNKDDYFEISDFSIIELKNVLSFNHATKLRAGKLTGIVDENFGSLNGYGIYTQNLYATNNTNIAGTLIAGDKGGVGASFYAGKIHKNAFINSLGVAFIGDSPALSDRLSLFGVGNVYKLDGNAKLFAQSIDWVSKNVDKNYCFSIYLISDIPEKEVTIKISGGYVYSEQLSHSGRWTKVHFDFHVIDNKQELTFELFGKDIYFTAPQLEVGNEPTLYQPTDSTLNYTDEYGAWLSRGGFGGTIQNPLVNLNRDGSIESRTGGFKINNDGSGHLANGALKFNDKKVSISFTDSNIGEEVNGAIKEVDDRLTDEVTRLETNFEIKEGQISSSVKKVEQIHEDVKNRYGEIVDIKESVILSETNINQTANDISQIAKEVEINYDKVTEETKKSQENAELAQEKADAAKLDAENAKKSAGESSQSYLNAKEKAELAQEEADRAKEEADKIKLIGADVTEYHTEIIQTAKEVSQKATEVQTNADKISKQETAINQTAEKITTQASHVEVNAGKVQENTTLVEQTAEEIKSTAENVAGDKLIVTQTAEEIEQIATDINGKQTEINQTADKVVLTAKDVQLNANKAKEQAGIATSKADEAKNQATNAQLEALNAQERANEAKIQAEDALKSAGESSKSYLDAKAKAEQAQKEASKATEQAILAEKKSELATLEANRAKNEADRAENISDTVVELNTEILQTAEQIKTTAVKVQKNAEEASLSSIEAKNQADKANDEAVQANLKALEASEKAEEALASAGASSQSYKDAKAEADKAIQEAVNATEKAKEANQSALDAQDALENVTKKETSINQTAEKISSQAVEVQKNTEDVILKHTEINQTAEKISLQAEDVDSNKTIVEQLADKVSSTAIDVEGMQTEIIQTSEKVASDAENVRKNKTSIEQTANRVSSDAKDVAGYKTSIEQTADEVSLNAQKALDSAGRAVEAEASINLKAEGIVLEASDLASKKAIDNLKIGSRNLFLNSDFVVHDKDFNPFNHSGWRFDVKDSLDCVYISGNTSDVLSAYGLAYGIAYRAGNFNVTAISKEALSQRILDKDIISYQSMVYVEEDTRVCFSINDNDVVWYSVPANEWTLLSHENHTVDFGNLDGNLFWCTENNKPFYITRVQLELGNKCTGWNRAPEDDIRDYKTSKTTFEVTSKSIEANVKEIERIDINTQTNSTSILQQGKSIELISSSVSSIDDRLKKAEISVMPDNIWLAVEDKTKDSVKSGISISANKLTVFGEDISMSGAVTFDSFDSKTSNDFQNFTQFLYRDIGDLAFESTVEFDTLGTTIIDGNYIKTGLINADAIVTSELIAKKIVGNEFVGKNAVFDKGTIGGWNIEPDFIKSKKIILDPKGGIKNTDGKWELLPNGDVNISGKAIIGSGAVFKGRLDGTTGTFRRLEVLDDNGNPSSGISFWEGMMMFDGDIMHQGMHPTENRGLNLYTGNLIARGGCGIREFNAIIIEGTTAKYYYSGYEHNRNKPYVTRRLEFVGNDTYKVPVAILAVNDGDAGVPYNVVIIKNTTRYARTYAFTQATNGHMLMVVSVDNKGQKANIVGNNQRRVLNQGEAQTWIHVNENLVSPDVVGKLGSGWFMSGYYDNNW